MVEWYEKQEKAMLGAWALFILKGKSLGSTSEKKAFRQTYKAFGRNIKSSRQVAGTGPRESYPG